MTNINVKKGDNVMVIAGKDKGKAGKVLKVVPETGRIYVEGINVVSKHVKPRNAQQKGGVIKQEGTIDVSNVMHICPGCSQIVRVSNKIVDEDGKQKKVRVCAKCGASLDEKKVKAKKAAKKVAKKSAKKTDAATETPAENKED